ncbi:tropinone reductase homolog At2g29150-like isoform X2 [Phragmites australis]|uniref:tropinone reductase homolog At2g29150-like isoform X2 n=1 Tax=Phragmites australis TaxID=29695 RepID=UPI002D7694A7|nr:tropinone reductase homolog At2g29150-like isoform X2 [Phragmites australis]
MAGSGGSSREERWSLAGATALITGGSKGIGHAIVEELAGFGARVHTCSRNAAELEECRRRWAEKGLAVTVSVCDVSVRADRENLMAAVKETFAGKLDILVNNAAQLLMKPAMECAAEDYAHFMTTNLESIFHLSQLAHPLLLGTSIPGGGGSIVNISSIAGHLGIPGRNEPADKELGCRVGPRQDSCELRRARRRHDGHDESGPAGVPGAGALAHPDAAERRAGGGRVRGVVPLHAGGLLRHRPSRLHRRRPDHKRMS